MNRSEPKVIVFCCNWGVYAGLDIDATLGLRDNPNIKVVRTMCSGRIEPSFILDAFAKGADGVMVAGCRPGDCHYQTGNYKARRRVLLLKNTLSQLGIEPERLRLEWISGSEIPRFQAAVSEFVAGLAKLGPLTPEKKAAEKVGVH